MLHPVWPSAVIVAALAVPACAVAAEPVSLPASPPVASPAPSSASSPFGFEWNARLRNEFVDDDAFASTSNATTLRVRAGLRMRWAHGFSALLEGEGIASAGDRYNSGANGVTTRPAITDPEGAELNQAYLAWKGGHAGATLGRQRLLFDNQRWIGNSGWRQNEQTFDAVAFDVGLQPGLTARYAWLDRVHRVSGDQARDVLARERNLDSHAFNLAWKRGVQQLVGYAYLHDDRDVATASTATWGLRAVTDTVHDGRGWGLALEWAQQGDYADNPLSFTHQYWLVEPAFTRNGIAWRAGWEHLGGNGRHALQTPLATLHAFNGWADKFLVTPPAGLEDRYLAAGGALGHGATLAKFKWALAWHDYRADSGSQDYGQEWNASLGFPVHGKLSGLAKLADYRSDGFARDTTKLWLQLEWAQP
ncbi:hypothetical protein J2X04_001377 [Lysobacter niabensis]|uniref:Alginate export domain-containing protein n=1 Tax=Agrilutibacter niabensis TaxID=380628 RepID=A0ABU1VNU9_9GAMM|nr:alginate export family protein [Lysobacter niabensis]MDR7099030.1 hypothetical protein [Lysobacter niabensis]